MRLHTAVLIAFSVVAPAMAQTSPTAARTVSAAVEVGSRIDANSGRWACAATSGLEILEVSSDVISEKVAYVLVERVAGEQVASQRLSHADVEAFRRLGCESSGETAAVIG